MRLGTEGWSQPWPSRRSGILGWPFRRLPLRSRADYSLWAGKHCALHRKTLSELEELTGLKITNLHMLGASANALRNHFTANAVQRPVIVAPADATEVVNVLGQALALGHIRSLAEARDIARNSFKLPKLLPYAAAWDAAYARLAQLLSA